MSCFDSEYFTPAEAKGPAWAYVEPKRTPKPRELTHALLVDKAVKWLRNSQQCGVILREHHSMTDEIPDAIGWRYGISILIECKVSRADFIADKKKPCRVHSHLGVGQYKYYMTPRGLLSLEELPYEWGLLETNGHRVWVMRKPEPPDEQPACSMKNEIRMMWSELRRYQANGITYPKLGGK